MLKVVAHELLHRPILHCCKSDCRLHQLLGLLINFATSSPPLKKDHLPAANQKTSTSQCSLCALATSRRRHVDATLNLSQSTRTELNPYIMIYFFLTGRFCYIKNISHYPSTLYPSISTVFLSSSGNVSCIHVYFFKNYST